MSLKKKRERSGRGPTQQQNILNLGGIKLFPVMKLSCDQTNHHPADTSTTVSALWHFSLCDSKLYPRFLAKFSNHHGVRAQLPAAFSFIYQAAKMVIELLLLQAWPTLHSQRNYMNYC